MSGAGGALVVDSVEDGRGAGGCHGHKKSPQDCGQNGSVLRPFQAQAGRRSKHGFLCRL